MQPLYCCSWCLCVLQKLRLEVHMTHRLGLLIPTYHGAAISALCL